MPLALGRIFGEGAGGSPAVDAAGSPIPSAGKNRVPASASDLAVRAREHYERALKAQRECDWALYGEEIKKLGEVSEQMR